MPRWSEERISENKHFMIIGDFVCGADDPLNEFLSDRAIRYDEEGLGNTYVFRSKDTIIAYYTIKANGIQVFNDETNEYDAIPVIEIARIAVAYDFQGSGFGRRIFYDYILPKVKEAAAIIGIQGVIVFVEPHNVQGIHFYKAIGFKRTGDSVQNAIGETFNDQCDLYMVKLSTLDKNEN